MVKKKNKLFGVLLGFFVSIGSLPAMDLQDPEEGSLKRAREEHDGEEDTEAKRPRLGGTQSETQSTSEARAMTDGELFGLDKIEGLKDLTPEHIKMLAFCDFEKMFDLHPRMRPLIQKIFQELKSHVEEAGEESNPDYQYVLGTLYMKGIPGDIEADFSKGHVLLEGLLSQDYASAYYFLSALYSKGAFGVEKNLLRSFELCKVAAKLDQVDAMFKLSQFYFGAIKDVLPVNSVKGFKLIKQLVDQGYELAKNQLDHLRGLLGRQNSNGLNINYLKSYLLKEGIFCTKNLKKSVLVCKRLAELGDLNAAYDVSQYFSKGVVDSNGEFILERSEQAAFDWCKWAAERGHQKACYQLSLYYLYGMKGIVEKNTQLRLEVLEKAACFGYSKAQESLLKYYFHEWSFKEKEEFKEKVEFFYDKLYQKGKKWRAKVQCCSVQQLNHRPSEEEVAKTFSLSEEETALVEEAMSGNREAQDKIIAEKDIYIVGEYSVYEKLVYEKKGRHIFILKAVADRGNSKAQYDLVELYFDGVDGVMEPEQHKSFDYLVAAANQGYAQAQYELACLYRDGLENIIGSDQGKEIEYLALAAHQQHSDAQYDLAQLYIDGVEDILESNLQKAILLLVMLVEKNDDRAACDLAKLYLTGVPDVFQRDKKTAIEFFKVAERKDNVEAILRLASLYREGIPDVLPQDLHQSFKLYEKASQLVDNEDHVSVIDIEKSLGEFYVNGIPDVLAIQKKKALYHYKHAADLGDAHAQHYYGWHCLYGLPEVGFEVNLEEAFKYVYSAVHQGYSRAFIDLGHLYQIGIPGILPVNLGCSLNCYKAACRNDFWPAYLKLGQLYQTGIPEILPVNLGYASCCYKVVCQNMPVNDQWAVDALEQGRQLLSEIKLDEEGQIQ